MEDTRFCCFGEFDVNDVETLTKLRHSGNDLTRCVDHHRIPVEDEFVLPPHLVDIRNCRTCLAGSLGEHLCPGIGLPSVIRRGVDIDDQRRTGPTQLSDGTILRPRVLTDRHSEDGSSNCEQRERLDAGDEVPLLVEHRIVGQRPLPVGTDKTTVDADRCAVIEVRYRRMGITGNRLGVSCCRVGTGVGCLGESHHDNGPTRGRDHPVQCGPRVADETRTQEKILGRVTGDGEFWEGHEIAPHRLGLVDDAADLLDVAVEITDDRIDLGKPHSDHGHGETLRRLPRPPIASTL